MNSPKAAPFLTFAGKAEEAMKFYTSVFPESEITSLVRFEEGQPGDVGKVMNGVVSIMGQSFMFLDMQSGFEVPAFTWSTSFYLSFEDEAVYDKALASLAEGGHIMMQEAPFMQFRKVAWVTDKYGVTWQPVLF